MPPHLQLHSRLTQRSTIRLTNETARCKVIRLNCPSCGKKLGVKEAMAGRMAICPQRKGKFRVPEEEIIITEAAVEEAVTAEPKPAPPAAPRAMPRPPPLPPEAKMKSAAPRRLAEDKDDEVDERPSRRSGRARPDDDAAEERNARRRRDDQDYDDEEDERDDEERAERKLRRQQMHAIRTGLTLFYWKFILYLVVICFHIIGSLVVGVVVGVTHAVAQRGNADLAQAANTSFLAVLLYGFEALATFVAAPILGITGGAFIVRVPAKSGARGLAIATLVLEAVPVVCGLLAMVTGSLSFGSPDVAGLSLVLFFLSGIALIAAFILFMLFLRQAAIFLKDKRTAQEAVSVMIAYLVTGIAGFIALVVVTVFLARIPLGGLVLFALVVAWIVLMIKQLWAILMVIAGVRSQI
jgi:hypothetical protein